MFLGASSIMDTPKRSFVKGVLWEIIGIFILFTMGVLCAGVPVIQMGALVLIYHIIRIILYSIYDQFWERKIIWGKIRKRGRST